MAELHAWLTRQLEDRLVEPNSSLGSGVAYMLKHREKLTLFLRVPGAPPDNNICERVLKKAILHRKNALFFKTTHGAHVGDVFMSLIYTCELCGANPFDYLTELERHADELAATPGRWMPWNYRQTLAALICPHPPTPAKILQACRKDTALQGNSLTMVLCVRSCAWKAAKPQAATCIDMLSEYD